MPAALALLGLALFGAFWYARREEEPSPAPAPLLDSWPLPPVVASEPAQLAGEWPTISADTGSSYEPAELLEASAPVVVPAPADVLGAVFTAGRAVLESFGVTARRVFALPAAAAPYAEPIARAEDRYGLPSSLLARVLHQESRFRPDVISGATRSRAGALGIAQFMPATAAELGVDPLNPLQAIDGAARYLRTLFDRLGDWPSALAAYNWGIGNVQRRGLARAPAETRAYVNEITADVEV
jgi:soluble lytic murein transglycosylase-like protein